MFKKNIALSMLVLILTAKSAMSVIFTEQKYFLGAGISSSSRLAIYELSENRVQSVNLNKLVCGEASFGKRYPLFSNFRLQVPFTFSYGVVDNDTLYDNLFENGTIDDIILSSSVFGFDFTPQLQYCIPITKTGQFYFFAGGGLSYTKIKERANLASDDQIRIEYRGLITDKVWCFSADCGAGFEFKIGGLVAAFQYTFKYWKPVKYKYYGDLFPVDGVDYSERFLTHGIQLVLLTTGNNN